MRKMPAIFAALFAGPLAMGSIASSYAADPLTLRVADSFPGGHYISEQVTKWYMDRVAKETGNKIAFQYYPSEQLGKAKDPVLGLEGDQLEGGPLDIVRLIPGRLDGEHRSLGNSACNSASGSSAAFTFNIHAPIWPPSPLRPCSRPCEG